jgi:hypothetical protein
MQRMPGNAKVARQPSSQSALLTQAHCKLMWRMHVSRNAKVPLISLWDCGGKWLAPIAPGASRTGHAEASAMAFRVLASISDLIGQGNANRT